MHRRTALLVILMLALAGCTPAASPASKTVDLLTVLPGKDAVAGWLPQGEAQSYNPDNLFDLVDGQAEAFFAYAFEQVAVRRYQNGDGTQLFAEVWRLENSENAYGLFSSIRAGSPAPFGVEGDTDPGRRIAFWQDRYVAQVNATAAVRDEDLQALAKMISAALPAGGQRPALVARLPQENLAANGAVFFREEISVQNEVWLGGANILKLGPDTAGLVGRYDLPGGKARLLLVQYAGESQAAAGLQALESAGLDGLVKAGRAGSLLGAVFGQASPEEAGVLLASALK